MKTENDPQEVSHTVRWVCVSVLSKVPVVTQGGLQPLRVGLLRS